MKAADRYIALLDADEVNGPLFRGEPGAISRVKGGAPAVYAQFRELLREQGVSGKAIDEVLAIHRGNIKAHSNGQAHLKIVPAPDASPETGTAAPVEEPNSWDFIALDDYLDGKIKHDPPTILHRSDGKALFYPRKRHLLVGDGESLKTWTVFLAGCEVMKAGGHFLAVDYENSAEESIERLLALGIDRTALATYFHLITPSEPLSKKEATALRDRVAAVRPAFSSIDSVGAGMGLNGLDPSDALDWFTFRGLVVQPVFEGTDGAVVAIDHRAKDRTQVTAIGSVMKRNSFDVEIIAEAVLPFGRGRIGRSNLLIGKDRAGHLRAASKDGKFFGPLVLTSLAEDGSVRGTIEAPNTEPIDSEQFAEKNRMRAVIKLLQTDPERPWRTDEIRLRLNWQKTMTTDTLSSLVSTQDITRTGSTRNTAYVLAEKHRPDLWDVDTHRAAGEGEQ